MDHGSSTKRDSLSFNLSDGWESNTQSVKKFEDSEQIILAPLSSRLKHLDFKVETPSDIETFYMLENAPLLESFGMIMMNNEDFFIVRAESSEAVKVLQDRSESGFNLSSTHVTIRGSCVLVIEFVLLQ